MNPLRDEVRNVIEGNAWDQIANTYTIGVWYRMVNESMEIFNTMSDVVQEQCYEIIHED